MALPFAPGLTPSEVGFLCEMEQVSVIPRQRLDALDLLGGPTKPLVPPFATTVPLWLALLLKRQRRANISPPAWLSVDSLRAILDFETDDRSAGVLSPPPSLPPVRTASEGNDPTRSTYLSATATTLEPSPPFLPPQLTAASLPYHWLEMAHLLLTHAADDFVDPDTVRRLVRDVREARSSKLRRGLRELGAGGGVQMNGVGGMELAEIRGFVGGVVNGLRRINRSREEARREREAEEGQGGASFRSGYPANDYDDDDDDMQL